MSYQDGNFVNDIRSGPQAQENDQYMVNDPMPPQEQYDDDYGYPFTE